MSDNRPELPVVEIAYHNPDDMDLDFLIMAIHNPDETERHKRQARRAIVKIKRRMSDPFIKRNRERLVRAHNAADASEVERLSHLIHEYDKKTYGN